MRQFFYSVMSGARRDWIAWVVRIPLWIVSFFYEVIVRVLPVCYSRGILLRHKLNVPVVSIGNVTLGGVGKTPMVILIARMLSSKKLKTVILTRGYGASSKEDSDEAHMLRESLEGIPVVVDRDRTKAGMEAIDRYDPDVLLLDDGFQHWRLWRDLEIVLIDSVNPFGNGHLLPAGILREPLTSLKRADILVLTKTDRADTLELKEYLASQCPQVPVVETVHQPKSLTNVYTKEPVMLSHICRPVVAFCAIGDPLSFKSLLVSLGADVKEFIHFIDHHVYSEKDMSQIRDKCAVLGIRSVITTEKDAVKLDSFKNIWSGYDVFTLNIELTIIQGQHELVDRINRL